VGKASLPGAFLIAMAERLRLSFLAIMSLRHRFVC
jgi:hypothetical protein